MAGQRPSSVDERVADVTVTQGPTDDLIEALTGMTRRVRRMSGPIMDLTTDSSVRTQHLAALIEAVNTLGRACSGVEASTLAAFARRDDGSEAAELVRGSGFVHDDAGLEIAHLLAVSEGSGSTRVNRAAELTSRMPLTLDAVTNGRIEIWQAHQILDECRLLDDHEAGEVDEWLHGRLGRIEPTRLRATARYAVGRVNPERLRSRAAKARRTRTLEVCPSAEPGLSQLYALIPSHQAAAIWEAASTLAKEYRELEPSLTADQARADAFVDLMLADVDVRASVTLGIPIVTSAVSSVGEAHDPPDVLSAPDQDYDGPGIVPDRIPDWVLDESDPGESCAPIHGVGPLAGAFTSGVTIPRVGHIPADVIALLLERLDLTISRALIDSRTGTVVETTTNTYTPPRRLRDFVVVRDGQCRMYGCARPAAACDLDHATPHDQGGATTPANLAGLCRHHHRAKQSRQWTYHLDPDTGTATWVSTRTGTIRCTEPATSLAAFAMQMRHGVDLIDLSAPTEEPADDPPPF